MKLITLIGGLALLLAAGCCRPPDDDEPSNGLCPQAAFIDDDLFDNGQSANFQPTEMTVDGDCLFLTFGASGCSGDSWTFELVGGSAIAESLPPQRGIRFLLDNDEACLAFFTRTVQFDIVDLRAAGEESVTLNLMGSDLSVLYDY
ncbi:hypothetical protein [Lewinella sp. W8]|uniref:hypothetical protein n=1 Tax=Lewinella sp. W8 TaxID=2528208 RepID=UPI0010687EFB|nr:hypothetical protein [Lewinella sp. W8]MTB50459.1 hypothetical protein [Lewinella sp. W8]